MGKYLILGAVFAGCAFTICVASFVFPGNVGEVSLENRASEPIDHALIEVCGQKFKFDNLEIGNVQMAKFKVGADSGYNVSIEFHSGRKIISEVGYVTSGYNYKDKLAVTDEQIILVSSSVSR